MCRNVRLTHTVRDNADRIKPGAKSGTKVFVEQDCHSPIGMNNIENYVCDFKHFYCSRNK